MLRKRAMLLVIIPVATALNVVVLAVNLSLPSRAAVSGMDAKALAADADFRKAVQAIIVECKVNVGIDKIRC